MSNATAEAPPDTGGGAATGQVRLWSKYRELRFWLRHDRYTHDPNIGRVLVEKGIRVQFKGGFATIDEEHLPLLMEHPSFTGLTEPKSVWFADDQEAVVQAARVTGTQVVTGAVGSHRPTSLEPPPTPGWDRATPEEIREIVWRNQVNDLVGAMRYETMNRNNELVIRYLAAAIAGQPVGSEEEIPAVDAFAQPDVDDAGFRPPPAPSGAETAADPWTPTGEIPPGSEAV